MRKAVVPLSVTLIAVAALLCGCSGQPAGTPSAAPSASGTHTMPNGMVMKDSAMSAAPSAAAKMICGAEAARSVQRNLELSTSPQGNHTWHAMTYTCTYPVGTGNLALSVKDLDSPSEGKAWFEATRARLGQAKAITGMANFGFPAVETATGKVAFLKDSKTLVVDASGIPAASLPSGATRQGVAYAIASGIIACWSE